MHFPVIPTNAGLSVIGSFLNVNIYVCGSFQAEKISTELQMASPCELPKSNCITSLFSGLRHHPQLFRACWWRFMCAHASKTVKESVIQLYSSCRCVNRCHYFSAGDCLPHALMSENWVCPGFILRAILRDGCRTCLTDKIPNDVNIDLWNFSSLKPLPKSIRLPLPGPPTHCSKPRLCVFGFFICAF